jgi:hypothetical protein
MAYVIFGYIDGIAYHLAVSDSGEVDGTDNAKDFLIRNEGTRVLATPTGPEFTLDPADPESILAAFSSLTEITNITGDPPRLYEPGPVGSVY